jgi:hypothetical protein
MPFYRKYVGVMSGEAWSAFNVTAAPSISAPASALPAPDLSGAVGGWALNAAAARPPALLPLYNSFKAAADPKAVAGLLRTSIPTFWKMYERLCFCCHASVYFFHAFPSMFAGYCSFK